MGVRALRTKIQAAISESCKVMTRKLREIVDEHKEDYGGEDNGCTEQEE